MKSEEDVHRCNFVLSTTDEGWVPVKKQWGLGFITVGLNRISWNTPTIISADNTSIVVKYLIRFKEERYRCVWNGNRRKSRTQRAILLTVTRKITEEGLHEEFRFANNSDSYILLDEIGIYSSFHDTYTSGEHALDTHVNQHIWAAGDGSYIETIRQSAAAPNFGLITMNGSFSSYQVEEINSSNFRGVIALVSREQRIAKGAELVISRLITSYGSHADFLETYSRYTGFPLLDYGQLILKCGETFRFSILSREKLEKVKISGEVMKEENGVLSFEPRDTGELSGKIFYGAGRIAGIRLRVIDDPLSLLRKRAHFIAERQQVNDPSDLRYGAYLPYDNERECIMRTEDFDRLYYSIPDRNDARERLGMGAFLAAWIRISGERELLPSLQRYMDFVERKLIDQNFDVWDSAEKQAAGRFHSPDLNMTMKENDMRYRSFNYVFVLALEAEMYRLTHEEHYARMCAGVLERYAEKYGLGGNTCMFGVDTGTVHVLRDAGLQDSADRMTEYLKNRAAYLRDLDDRYDSSEVIYEQGTTASVMREIALYYLETGDASYLECLKKQAERTMAFEGEQPDYRSYHSAVLHWDDYWFGKMEMWGDTMPHYWDTISADAYCLYAAITGDRALITRAETIFRNNLALIHEDGSCDNCYVYPEKVNGRPGARTDQLSNDQDWAFYTYIKAHDFLKERKLI
jgi:hypothetical protein